jgi:photosystem II stability/assembly factor-like uncharacterized protein
MRLYRTGIVFLPILGALLLAACNGGGGTGECDDTADCKPPWASITVMPDADTLFTGDTLRLSATVRDDNGNPMTMTIAWTTLTQTIASVDTSGLVTALAAGDAVLVASAGGFSDTARVLVRNRPAVCVNEEGNGQTVTSGPSGPNSAHGDNDTVFRGFLIDLLDPLVLYLGTERNGIVRSTDGGLTWTRSRLGIRWNDVGYPEIWSLAQNPANPAGILAATTDSPGPLNGANYPSANAGIYRSENSGQSWARSNCGLTNAKMSFVIFVPGSSTTLVASAQAGAPSFSNPPAPYYTGGLFRSTDGGTNWARASAPAMADSMEYWQILARGNQLITFAFLDADLSRNVGFLRSTDGGVSWAPFGASVRTKRYYFWVASAGGDTLFAAEPGGFVIDRSVDGGAIWTPLTMDGMPGAVAVLAMSPANSRLVFYASGENKLLRSTDGYATRSVVLTTPDIIQAIRFAPSAPDTVYAVTRGYLVYRSIDAGVTWSLRKNVRADVLNVLP